MDRKSLPMLTTARCPDFDDDCKCFSELEALWCAVNSLVEPIDPAACPLVD